MNARGAVASVLIIAIVSGGCAAKQKLTARERFDQATRDFENEGYQLAIDQYREMLDQHPFDELGEQAELKIAHAQFLSGAYAEAVASLTDFQRRHPTSPWLPFVGYLLGECYRRQMGTIDRDQTASQNAHNYFATLAQQYPDSVFAELAREQLAFCRNTLAGHELYVAEFYSKREKYKAAEHRLLGLVGRYDDTDVAPDALGQLARIYRDTNDTERALLADATLVQHYPNSPRTKAAERRLARAGDQNPLVSGDPMPILLAGVPRSRDLAFAPPVQVPGLEPRQAPLPPSTSAFGPPAGPFSTSPGGF